MRALCPFKSVSDVQVLFVFRQIRGPLASEPVPSKEGISSPDLYDRTNHT